MSKNTTAAAKIQDRIRLTVLANVAVISARFSVTDESVQAEQRLRCSWEITYQCDRISCKKDLASSDQSRELWQLFHRDERRISSFAKAAAGSDYFQAPVSLRTKSGPALREEQKAEFALKNGREFLAAVKSATGKTRVKKFTEQVASIQADQKTLLAAMRKSNADYLASKKQAKADVRAADAAALASGEFWRACREAIKDYFHPPFDKNYLADVSERWRAALFLECESTGYKDYYGNWRHKLVGTGRAYLCGIDDNGDEWGHQVRIDLDRDQHDNQALEATVEEAMAELFEVEQSRLYLCTRQGDLLFRPCVICKTPKQVCSNCGKSEAEHQWPVLSCYEYSERVLRPVTLDAETEWTVRESHTIKSPSLRHNGIYFAADDEIIVEHTSHQPVILPAGEYCLHALAIADAD